MVFEFNFHYGVLDFFFPWHVNIQNPLNGLEAG